MTAREEYVQIFSNIPQLFEYLIDTLEKRPEILEDNRNSAFMLFEDDRNKRESDLQALDEGNSNEGTDKDEDGDVVDVIERHEYGKSIKKMKKIRKSSTSHENKEGDTNKGIKVLNKVDVTRIKRSNEFGDSYIGSTNIMSNVSPEEVEEMAIKVEKEIENHVKNRQNRDLK